MCISSVRVDCLRYLVARYTFGACFALLQGFCFGAVAAPVAGKDPVACEKFFNVSLSRCVFSRELFHSVPLCCALFFGRCFEEPCVCDVHTPVLHFGLAPLCFVQILCTFSRRREGCVCTIREDLHLTVGTRKFHSRDDHSSYCRVDTWPVACPSGCSATVCSTPSKNSSTLPR